MESALSRNAESSNSASLSFESNSNSPKIGITKSTSFDESIMSLDTASNKPISNSMQLSQQNMSLLNQMINPSNNYLDEEAIVLAIDKSSNHDTALRARYNKYCEKDRYHTHMGRQREVSSQSRFDLFAGGMTMSYPFYLSSSSSSCSFSSSEVENSDDSEDKKRSKDSDFSEEDQKKKEDESLPSSNSDQDVKSLDAEKKQESKSKSSDIVKVDPVKKLKYSNQSSVKMDKNKDNLEHLKNKRRMKKGRITRGMARDIKDKRKEERETRDQMGLVSLISAAKELEGTYRDESMKYGRRKRAEKIRSLPVRSSRRRNLPKSLKDENKVPLSSLPKSVDEKKQSKRTRKSQVKPSSLINRRKKKKLDPKNESAKTSPHQSSDSTEHQASPTKTKMNDDKSNNCNMELNATLPNSYFYQSSRRGGNLEKKVLLTLNEKLYEYNSSDPHEKTKRRNEDNGKFKSSKKKLKSIPLFGNERHHKSGRKGEMEEMAKSQSTTRSLLSRSSSTDSHSSLISNPDLNEKEQNNGNKYSESLFSFLSQKNSSNNTVSLSLRDWRRRQQWVPLTPSSNNIMPEGITCSDFAIATPTSTYQSNDTPITIQTPESPNIYSELNPIPSHEDVRLVGPKAKLRRHCSMDYAKFCCDLVHCLTGSGRSNAHHEFFYSDIDRAWYNFNGFKVDVVRLGLPPDVKLTRREWSMVRRKIRKRPRRFSKSFIKTEMDVLERYRDSVRHIQFRNDPEAVPNFPFEVPAPIKIGAPVTAYNKKARVLHRGIVLTRDPYNKRYMVQFERAELGCEFCPDTEIASHGVPDIIRPCTEMAFDESHMGGFAYSHSSHGHLPYGTTYGPLTGFQHEEVQASDDLPQKRRNQGVARALDSELVESKENEHTNYNIIKEKNPLDANLISMPILSSGMTQPSKKNEDQYIDIETEKECLIKLLSMFDALIERKAYILGTLDSLYDYLNPMIANEEFHKSREIQCRQIDPNNEKKTNIEHLDDLIEHHSWLYANLEFTNQSIEDSLFHMQVMYGQVYSNSKYFSTNLKERNMTLNQRKLSRESKIKGLASPWFESLNSTCNGIANSIATKRNEFTLQNVKEEEKTPREIYIESKLSKITSLILSSQMFKANYSKIDVEAMNMKGPDYSENEVLHNDRKLVHPGHIEQSLNESLQRLSPQLLPWGHRSKSDDIRAEGYYELRKALSLLHAELDVNRREAMV